MSQSLSELLRGIEGVRAGVIALSSEERTLEYVTYGGPDATKTIIFHHGSPFSAGCLAVPSMIAAIPPEFNILAITRPGYGQSTRDPKRTPATVALDATEMVALLGLNSVVAVMGHSLGSLYAVETAREFETPVILISGVAPVINNRLLGGMAEMQKNLYRAVCDEGFRLPGNPPGGELVHDVAKNAVEADKLCAFDVPEIMAALVRDAEHATLGDSGFVDDLDNWIAQREPLQAYTWGGRIIHGMKDTAAPYLMGQTNAANLKLRLSTYPDGGHYLLYYAWENIMADVLKLINNS